MPSNRSSKRSSERSREAASAIEADPAFPDSLDFRLHTPLASGADQIAAKSAHAVGYHVSAILPFVAEEYRNDFEGPELDEFEGALDAAHEIVALPGARSDPVGAYVHVGKALIDASDIMVAIWDGGKGNGPGGTAHVVELALESSVPVIHIAIDRDAESVTTRLLVGGKARRACGPVAVRDRCLLRAATGHAQGRRRDSGLAQTAAAIARANSGNA